MLRLPRCIQIRAWLEAGPSATFNPLDNKLDASAQACELEKEYRARLITAAAFTSHAADGLLDTDTMVRFAKNLIREGCPIGNDMLAVLISSKSKPFAQRSNRVQYVFDDVQRLRYLYDYQHQANGQHDPENIFPWCAELKDYDVRQLELELLKEIFQGSGSQLCRRIHEQFLKRPHPIRLHATLSEKPISVKAAAKQSNNKGVSFGSATHQSPVQWPQLSLPKLTYMRGGIQLPSAPSCHKLTVFAEVLSRVAIT